MKITLNEDEDQKQEIELMKFPAGELHVKLKNVNEFYCALIETRINSSDDLMNLLLTTDALRGVNSKTNIEVKIPYIPYARQDRRMVEGEPMSLKVFAKIINSQNYDKVYCYDPHSDVTLALIENLVALPIYNFVSQIDGWQNMTWVSPDAGQLKKIYSLAKKLGYTGHIVTATKVRDLTNGKILRTELDTTRLDGECLVLDDICSYGGTFKALSKKLIDSGAKQVKLFTTHNEMVFDEQAMKDSGVSQIYSTNSIKENDKYSPEYFIQFQS